MNFPASFGKSLIVLGVVLVVVGLLLIYQDKFPLLSKFGKLPGDIRVEKENYSFYFPIATCILISAFLSLLGLAYKWFTK